ncbi:MAG TPA: phosphodiester glycosidase family protein [Gemmatimonadales bacterium]|nr:phosphodiester glycosidase family protein [Gemmatimonadales bacterium]
MTRAVPALLLTLTLAAPGLSLRTDAGWIEWWRGDRAPARWAAAHPLIERAVRWRPSAPGVEWGEMTLSGSGEAWRVRVIAVRLDPARIRIATDVGERADGRPGPWTLDSAPAGALLALNAGQFTSGGPWGWLVRDGVERQPPGTGPLAPALVVDTTGRVRLVPADGIAGLRAALLAGDRSIREAFQSYPAILLGDGDIPLPLREAGRGVDLEHRDARLALGLDRRGRLLVALTRFEGLGGILENLPFGLTTPEMAAVMGALGARRAMLLDGGLSSQLRLREASGETHAWRGMRKVPMGLVVTPR